MEPDLENQSGVLPEEEIQNTMLRAKIDIHASEIESIAVMGAAAVDDPQHEVEFLAMHSLLREQYDLFLMYWEQIRENYIRAGKYTKAFKEEERSSLAATKDKFYKATASHIAIQRKQAVETSARASELDTTVVRWSLGQSAASSMPEIKLPNFSGDIAAWQSFQDRFESLVHHNTCLAPNQKFHYLLSAVSGSALSRIKRFPVTDQNYPLAWNALVTAYSQPRLLASTYIDTILNFKPHKGSPTEKSLEQFLTEVGDSVELLNKLNVDNLGSFLLFALAIRGLDDRTRHAFEIKNLHNQFPSSDDLFEFVRERIHAEKLASASSGNATTLYHQYPRAPPRPSQVPYSSSSKASSNPKVAFIANNRRFSRSPPRVKCYICKQNHVTKDCYKFKAASVSRRHEMLQGWTGCRNCLREGHSLRNCPSSSTCSECAKRHHSMLHIRDPVKPSSSQESSSALKPSTSGASNVPESERTLVGSSIVVEESKILLGTIVVNVANKKSGEKTEARFILDSGAHHSMLTSACARKINLPIKHCNYNIYGVGQSLVSNIVGSGVCSLAPRNSHSLTFDSEMIIASTIVDQLPSTPLPRHLINRFINLELSDPCFGEPGKIDGLLGMDLFSKIVIGPPQLNDQGPYLLPTIFGLVVMGPYKEGRSNKSYNFLSIDLKAQLQKFWELEEPPQYQPKLAPEDEFCEQHFVQNHYREPNGRFVVALPFKPDEQPVSDSSYTAMKRFINLEAKLEKSPSLRKLYNEFMEEYIQLGFLEETRESAAYVVPHHAVVRESSLTTKLRVVFDFSCPTKTGSLNNKLLVGPKLHPSLNSILLNFRLFPYVFTADISKMFPNINLRPQDRKYQHLYWRFNPQDEVKEYQLNILSFGLVSAPYLALRVIHQLAREEGTGDLQRAASRLTQEMYVDDLITGDYSIDGLLDLQNQFTRLLQRGGFSLSKWSSNCPELLKNIKEVQSTPFVIASEEQSSVKILGLQWNPLQDVFSYQFKTTTSRFTKRAVLSVISSIFDPEGYIAPVTLKGKIIMQKIFKEMKNINNGKNWDVEITGQLKLAWEKFINQMSTLTDVNVPRYLCTRPGLSCQLIGFADASEEAYGAVIYLRVEEPEPVVHLIRAKTRVAPLKQQTIPRLELCACLLLAKLFSTTMDELKGKLEINSSFLFTDSSTALTWLQTPTHRLKIFVASRVNEILELTGPASWHHVNTSHNPADCASRGLDSSQLIHYSLWWGGPSWLQQPLSDWPANSFEPLQDVPETKNSSIALVATPKEQLVQTLLKKHSSLNRLIRIVAYIRRMFPEARKIFSTKPKSTTISATEFEHALTCLIIQDQHHHFPEIKLNQICTNKQLQKLDPYLDDLGLIRVGGRLKNSNLPESQKHPILLHRKSDLTKLIVDNFHQKYYHAGPSLLDSLITANYWIPSRRNLIRYVVYSCNLCRRFRSSPITQKMADLPDSRFSTVRAFDSVGIDFAGPFMIRESMRRKAALGKCYLCLYVCMSTKALHLEAVSNLTTSAFLASFKRFIARRGYPAHIYSDNGSNFVGASRHLQDLQKWLMQGTTQDELITFGADKNISWHFNSPYSPHHGGLWEAGVKTVKSLLRQIIGNTQMTFEELSTTFCQIESLLNSRPLSSLSEDVDCFEMLTPAHFLVGGPLLQAPSTSLVGQPENRLKRWELVQKKIQHFWSRWRKDYLNRLQQRTKWLKPSKNLSVGDLVIIITESAPPGKWPLGRVAATHPGSDGLVRVVTLRTANGTTKRPVTKLIQLSTDAKWEIAK